MTDYCTFLIFFIYDKMTYSQITAFDLLNESKSKTHIPPTPVYDIRAQKKGAGHNGLDIRAQVHKDAGA